jgi:hypothetical protein
VAEAIGDGSEKVANQPKQHLRGSTERSNRGIISAMRDSGVVKKNPNGICSATDLEDILPFYLALNAIEYHDLNPHRGRLRAYLISRPPSRTSRCSSSAPALFLS